MSRTKRLHVRRNRRRRQCNRGEVMRWSEHFGHIAKMAKLEAIGRDLLALRADIRARGATPTMESGEPK